MAVRGIERVRVNSRRRFGRAAGEVTDRAVYTLLSSGAAFAAILTPVETGNLINSQYAPQLRRGNGFTTGHVGYTADYAGAVHDMPGTLKGLPRASGRGNYWDPGGQPEFLEQGIEEVMKTGMGVLRREYRV